MMAERKLFKTKLCSLYRKGHCPRQSCSFAHGNAELRRFSGSFNGRRDYRGGDLRDKIDRRHSPLRRYSADRDARGRHSERGYSPDSSPAKRSDRRRRKKQQLDGQSDLSGSENISDGTDDRTRDRKPISSDSKDVLRKQLRQVRSDIDMMNEHKRQLETYLEESTQEVDCLASRIGELEMQLCHEKEECKRITSKIKKFVKSHNRYWRLQEEVKRSQDRLQKLGDQLSSDAARLGANEEDSSINILSDEETTGHHTMSSKHLEKNASPNRKRLRVNEEATESKSAANLINGEGTLMGTIRLGKQSRWNVQHAHSNNTRRAEVMDNGSNEQRTLACEDRPKRGKIGFTNVPSAEKFRGSEPGFLLPSTSMAAHAVDDVLDAIEVEENEKVGQTASTGVVKGAPYAIPGFQFPLPPPPPLPKNAYSQLQGEDENIDVVAVEEEEMVNVDVV